MATERLFAAIRTRGAGWDGAQSREGQRDWEGHAPDVLLIIRTKTSDEIRARLAADPWTMLGSLP